MLGAPSRPPSLLCDQTHRQRVLTYLPTCSCCSIYLLAPQVGRQYSEVSMGEDGWITFVMPHAVARLIAKLRELLDRLLQAKIERPQIDLSKEGASIIRAAVQLITSE